MESFFRIVIFCLLCCVVLILRVLIFKVGCDLSFNVCLVFSSDFIVDLIVMGWIMVGGVFDLVIVGFDFRRELIIDFKVIGLIKFDGVWYFVFFVVNRDGRILVDFDKFFEVEIEFLVIEDFVIIFGYVLVIIEVW